MINSDKYEMRPLLARTTFPSVNSSPPAVAARADHILKPGQLVVNSMTRAAVAQVWSACFRLAGHTNLLTSAESGRLLTSPARLHCLRHFEDDAVPVVVFLLWNKSFQICSNLVFLLLLHPHLTVLARQQHSSLSESRLEVAQILPARFVFHLLPGTRAPLATLLLCQIWTACPSVGLRPDDGPGPGGLPRPALRAARTPGAP